MTMIGASLLWFGWFGFNAGSALEANGSRSARLPQHLPRHGLRGALLDHGRVDPQGQALDARRRLGRRRGPGGHHPGRRQRRHPGRVRHRHSAPAWCASGASPASRSLIKADDSLDVFGVHALGGIFGALMTGIFNAPFLGGPGITDWVTGAATYPGIAAQFLIQLRAVCVVVVWTAVVAFARLSAGQAPGRPAGTRGRGARGPRHHRARRAGLRPVTGDPRGSRREPAPGPLASGGPFFVGCELGAGGALPRCDGVQRSPRLDRAILRREAHLCCDCYPSSPA